MQGVWVSVNHEELLLNLKNRIVMQLALNEKQIFEIIYDFYEINSVDF